MKVFLVFFATLVAVSALSDHEQWIAFKNEYGRNYKSVREETFRFGIFQENLRTIEAHNDKYDQGKESYTMDVNQFADLTQEEFEKMYTAPHSRVSQSDTPNFVYHAEPYADFPESVDWRKEGAVTRVQDQGSCGCSHAFSAGGAIEGQLAIKHKVHKAVSYQELLDCSGSADTSGCETGRVTDAFDYVKKHGIAYSNDYKYRAVQGACKESTVPRMPLKVTGYVTVDYFMQAIERAVGLVGPLSATVYHKPIVFYSKGIINSKSCTKSTTITALIVGYGTENGTDYWIVKNSWGTKWGEDGYFRITRDEFKSCGLYEKVVYPYVE